MDELKIKKNVKETHDATQKSRFNKEGLTTREVELSSKNFKKLMMHRGLKKEEISTLKASFDRSKKISARHAKKGETFIVTHGKQNASGVFVSDESLGKTPNERIDKGSLPASNTAEYETRVSLDRDQDLVYGKIAPQPAFQKTDPEYRQRNGGGTQIITDGGYRKGAIRNTDSKYPAYTERPSKTPHTFKNSLNIHNVHPEKNIDVRAFKRSLDAKSVVKTNNIDKRKKEKMSTR